MRCLVSGGAGFIGSHIVDALVARGDRVAVLDDLSTGTRANLTGALERGVTLHAADIRDLAEVRSVFAATRPEVVFHLAAQVDVRRSVEDPAADLATNVLGTIHVLQAASAVGARRFVNTSTGGGIYGEAEVFPTPEDPPVRPLAPYGQGKLAAEGYCEVFARLHGLATISLRYANVYGPRQDPYGEGGVVAIFCACLAEGRRPTIYGDGRQTRDWIEVADVVRANLLAADSDLTGSLNIGSGRETSVLELVEVLNDVSANGRISDVTFAPRRTGEVLRSFLDSSRARDELGWVATIELRQGLRGVLDALSNRPAT